MKISSMYRAAVAVAVPLVPIFLRQAEARRAHAGRLAAAARLESWAQSHRDPKRPLVWFHAASVGEGLQARAVMMELRKLRPEIQLVATRFSASAERLTDSLPADLVEYLPYDRGSDVKRVLTALIPDLLVFAKLDLWPVLTTEAAAVGCKVALVAGAVDPASRRLTWPGRQVAAPGYAALAMAAANSRDDAGRLQRLGVDPGVVHVTGDPRVDSVLQEISERPTVEGRDELDPRMMMVAGSTWPGDEIVLLDSLRLVRKQYPLARMLVVPHQPSPERSAAILQQAKNRGLSNGIWGGEEPTADRAVQVVDRLGVLAGLYPVGGTAYVGGGFGSSGVHSVIEPAGWSLPVIIGPRDRGLRDAKLLSSVGALERLPEEDPVAGLTAIWSGWLADPERHQAAGAAAKAALASERGAAIRTAILLSEMLPDNHR